MLYKIFGIFESISKRRVLWQYLACYYRASLVDFWQILRVFGICDRLRSNFDNFCVDSVIFWSFFDHFGSIFGHFLADFAIFWSIFGRFSPILRFLRFFSHFYRFPEAHDQADRRPV